MTGSAPTQSIWRRNVPYRNILQMKKNGITLNTGEKWRSREEYQALKDCRLKSDQNQIQVRGKERFQNSYLWEEEQGEPNS